MKNTLRGLVCAILMAAAVPALAEFQCAPTTAKPALPENDKFFASEAASWLTTTSGRYLEGDGKCPEVVVPGYEEFPAKRCSYSTADAGKGAFPLLAAEVIVLNPSSRQLASWSINACRTNGAKDSEMPNCLSKLRSFILGSNGAQFPIVGSAVESYCNSGAYGGCEGLAKVSKTHKGLQPRHTWFRDGVSVDYSDAQGVKWDGTVYSKSTFDAVLDVAKSDLNLNNTFTKARIAGALRDEWITWRNHIGKPVMPDSGQGTVVGGGWRTVAASVHKAACRGASNELIDAVVFSHPKWTKPAK